MATRNCSLEEGADDNNVLELARNDDLNPTESTCPEIVYSRQPVQLGNDRRSINVANSSYVNIAVGKMDYPGISCKDTLNLMIKDAAKDFVETRVFHEVKQKLDEHDCITISGAPGEGKTTLALMLAELYRTRGYELAFVNDISVFKPDLVFRDCPRVLLILDDVFGCGEPEIKNGARLALRTLQLHMKHSKQERQFSDVRQSMNQGKRSEIGVDKQFRKKEKRVIFTSKTYNLKDGLDLIKEFKNTLFERKSLINLTTQKEMNYNDKEKRAIFSKLKLIYLPQEYEFDVVPDIPMETFSFGFPLTCKLYFQLYGFHKDHAEFFTKPLYYLRSDIDSILKTRDSKASILSLVLILDRPFSLSELDNEEQLEHIFQALQENEFSCGRIAMKDQAKALTGTYLKADGSKLSFEHSSIYDAVACALAERHTPMVLKFCTIDLLCHRIRIPQDSQIAFHTEVDEYLNIIYLSADYFDLLVHRLLSALQEGQLSLVLTYQGLNTRILVDKLIGCIPTSLALSTDRAKKSFLYWTTYIKSPYLCQKTMEKSSFKRNDIFDALQGCALNGNVDTFVILNKAIALNKTEQGICLVTASSHGQLKMVRYLLDNGADILYRNLHGDNSLLVACEHGFTDIVRVLVDFQDGKYLQKQILIRKRVQIDKIKLQLSPVMMTILHGHEDTFIFLLSKNIDISEETCYGNCLHLATHSGNVNIVREIISKNQFPIDIPSTLGYTPLMNSCMSDSKDVYMYLISLGADVQHTDEAGYSGLHWASCIGNISIIQDILDRTKQLFVNSTNKDGLSPIMFAALYGQTKAFHLLESHGAEISMVNTHTNTDCLQYSCVRGQSELVRYLVEVNCFDVDKNDINGYTSWMIAAVHGNATAFDIVFPKSKTKMDCHIEKTLGFACHGGSLQIVNNLIENGRFLSRVNVTNKQGLTPFMEAVANGHVIMSKYLISQGTDVESSDNDNRNVLHYACASGNVDVARDLIEKHKFDVNGLDGKGYTPMMYAVLNGRKETIEYLHTKGGHDMVIPYAGTSLLHLAVQGQDVDFVDAILSKGNIGLNRRDQSEMTALMHAAQIGNAVIVEYLVDRGADMNVTCKGANLLHYACSGGNTVVLKYLLSTSNLDIESRTDIGQTPLMIAVIHSRLDAVYFLMHAGANISAKDYDGNSLLHLVGDLYTAMQVYLKTGFNNDENANRHTPLMVSVIGGKTEIYGYLMSKCKKTQFFRAGSTLLHLACSKGQCCVVSFMLSQKMCDINYRDAYGNTPAMVACQNGHQNVVDILTENGCDLYG